MKFNWFNLLTAVPYIMVGIQQIHTDAKGATKKQLALEALGLATAASQAVLPPEQAQQAAAVSSAVSNIIDNMVAAFHATNVAGFGNTSPSVPATGA